MDLKNRTALVLCASMLLAFGVSCGAKETGETLTGSARGYGGDVTVTLTRENGVITACSIEGAGETPEVGGKALGQLEEQVVAANGFAIDGVSGATVTTRAVKTAVAGALGEEYREEPKPVETPAPAEIVDIEGGLQIGRALGAAHGTGCFTQAFAVVRGDVIVASWLDDFQFVDTDMGLEAVPNSDKGLGEGYAEGKALTSKRLIADAYSQIMAEKGGSTVPINENFDAIQSYTAGKTIGELETAANHPNVVDAVSGATLADTAGYLRVIGEAARNAREIQGVEFSGDSADLKLTAALGAAHGGGCFTSAAALTEGDKVILCYVDDFQFLDRDAGAVPVPNSDAEFGESVAEGKVLTAKRLSTKIYSQVMAEKGGSTVPIDASFDAIQRYAAGKTTAELDSAANHPNVVDAVSGATLADTAGYLKVIADTARAGK